MAPMTRQFSPGGVPGEDVAEYYARRAAGGVGLIITEGTYVGHESAGDSDRVPRFHGEDALAGWAKVADAVHRAGGAIMPQLWHVGMVRAAGDAAVPDAPAVGPSGIGLEGAEVTGKAMTQQDLDDVIAAFADGGGRRRAHRLRRHRAARRPRLPDRPVPVGGHQPPHRRLRRRPGRPDPVRRRDRGRLPRGRLPPTSRSSSATRSGSSRTYEARLAATPQELEALLTPLAEAGVDAFHASTRRYWLPEFDGSDLNLAGWTKKLTGRPTITRRLGRPGRRVHKAFQGEGAAVTDIDDLLDRLEPMSST